MENKFPKMTRLHSLPLAALSALALISSLWVSGAFAQTSGQGGTASDRNYRIGSGDLLKIEVVGRPDMTGNQTVSLDGMINLSGIGPVKAVERTTAELAIDLSRRISLIQREIPQVIVTLVESRSRKVFVLGSVLIPGSYPMAENSSIWDAIAEAGGPTEDANLSAVEVIPGTGGGTASATVDIAAAIREGRLDKIQRLKPGDTVRVPRGAGATGGLGEIVYLFGAVAQQGPRPVEPGGLVQTIIKSTPTADADYEKVEIVRTVGKTSMRMRINVHDYLTKASPTGNPALQSGDTVFIPRKEKGFNPLSTLSIFGTLLALTTSVVALSNRH